MVCYIVWLAGLVALAGCLVRIRMYARTPLHLRWEIYPVPEGHAGQARAMVPEILFLLGLYHYNRPLWRRSFPFHLGLYCLLGAGALVCVTAVTGANLLRYVYVPIGAGGAVLVLGGGTGLLLRRLTDPKLRAYTTAGDIFNLAFFLVSVGLLAAGFCFRRVADPGAVPFVSSLLRFDATAPVPPLLAAGTVLAALFAAYIPMTHMSHFIAKYFTYHRVRWDERAAAVGGTLERRMAEYLMYRPTWSAPHMAADGRTWAEVATANPAKGAAK